MALAFSWRADDANIYARHSNYGKQGSLLTIGGPTRSADAGAIGGFSLDCTTTTATRGIYFPGKNMNTGRAFSLNVRIKPNYTGSPAANRAIFMITAGRPTTTGLFVQASHLTTGNITIFAADENGSAVINSVSAGAWSPTSGTWYDLSFSWDGTATASSFKTYVDSALLGSISPSGALSASITLDHWKSICLGVNGSGLTPAASFNELSIWTTTTDFTSNVALESGNGLLNGASRTSFVSDVAGSTLTSFDGLNSTDPGIANVKSGTTYFINGTSYTGTEVAASGGSHCASNLNWSN